MQESEFRRYCEIEPVTTVYVDETRTRRAASLVTLLRAAVFAIADAPDEAMQLCDIAVTVYDNEEARAREWREDKKAFRHAAQRNNVRRTAISKNHQKLIVHRAKGKRPEPRLIRR